MIEPIHRASLIARLSRFAPLQKCHHFVQATKLNTWISGGWGIVCHVISIIANSREKFSRLSGIILHVRDNAEFSLYLENDVKMLSSPQEQQKNSISYPSSPLVWFLLVDSSTGGPYKDTSVSSVLRSSLVVPVVDQFRKAVKAEFADSHLKGIAPSDLMVFKNKASFDNRSGAGNSGEQEALDPPESLGLLGSQHDVLVVVVVPPPTSSRSTSESSVTGREPDPKRKQRWVELNEILDGNSKKSKTNDSTAYSYVTWNQVKSVFNPANYIQPRQNIDDAHLNFFAQYLSITTRCFGDLTTGREAKRLHFIAPILICVCFLFEGDVDIVVEEDLVGNFVKAHGHFEFMLRRGRKAICIVEAKKDDVEQSMAQDLVGCEVAAEVGGLDVVYGIVTNYIQWNFLCSLNDKVQREECSLRLTPNGPELESLREIAEKIYAMLSS